MLNIYFSSEKFTVFCILIDKPPPIEPVYENTSKKTTNSDTNLVNNLEICM